MADTAVVTCVNHRRRPKVVACGTCGNPLCADCVVRTSVGVKCASCTGSRTTGVFRAGDDARGASPTRSPRFARSAGSGGGERRRLWPVALLAAGVLVLAVAGYGLVSGGGSGGSGGSGLETGATTPAGALGPIITERNSEFVSVGGVRLGGTLTLPPATAGQKVAPAVLIVPGLGAVDRNAVAAAGTPDGMNDALSSTLSVSSPGTPDPLYQDLAQALASVGVASFRYDKRGTTAARLRPDQKLSLDDEVADAKAALDFLAQRQEIGSSPLAVLGQDEGAFVALRAAAGNPRVKAAVLVSTPGRPLGDVLADDFARSRGADVGDQMRAAVAAVRSTGKAPAPDSLSPLLRPLFPAAGEGYLAALFSLDPVAEAANVGVPALIVRSGGDTSITAADSDRLVAAIKPGAEVLVGSSDADHNLSFGAPGHDHSNNVTAPANRRDADTGGKLATWVKSRLGG